MSDRSSPIPLMSSVHQQQQQQQILPPPPPPPYSKAPPTTSTSLLDIKALPAISGNITSNNENENENEIVHREYNFHHTAPDVPQLPSIPLNQQRSYQQLAQYQQQLQQFQQQQQHKELEKGPHNQHNLQDYSAAQALTQLTRSNTPPLDIETIATTEGDAASLMSTEDANDDTDGNGTSLPRRHPLVSTVSMVAKHPIVMNAVKYYENSKRNYPSFNYAAGIVEAAAIPVVTKIEDNLNTRHQFQQINSSRKQSSSMSSAATSINLTPVVSNDHKPKKRRFSTASNSSNTSITSIDVKKRLQFCIHILRAANANINSKLNFLQTKINETEEAVREERVKLQIQQSHESQQVPYSTDEAAQKTKSEIVTTVKKIIHLISNFRPSTLNQAIPPTIAQQADINGNIIFNSNSSTRTSTNTSTNTNTNTNTDGNSNTLTPTSSHHSSVIQEYELKNTIRDIILHLPASLQRSNEMGDGHDRVFVFAKESLDMITKLTNVFSEQLVKVESWVTGEEEQEQQQQQQQQQQSKHLQVHNVEEYKQDAEMKDGEETSTRCSSEEPDGLTSATKRMRIDELVT